MTIYEKSTILISVFTACFAGLAVFVAWKQLHGMRQEAKKDRTLNICFAYDIDPTLAPLVMSLRKNENLSEEESTTLLNYFDVIAIGVAQKNYDWDIVYHQFKNIIPKVVGRLRNDMFEIDYPDLQSLQGKIEQRSSDDRCV